MSDLSQLNSALSAAGVSWLSDFSSIIRFEFSYVNTNESALPWLEITLETERFHPNKSMILRFLGVRNLRVEEFGDNITQLSGLNIEDIKSMQWENINWKVNDYEDDKIFFYCGSFLIVEVI